MAKVKCSCKHPFQDKRYGEGIRIANKATKSGHLCCTVCGKTHTKSLGGEVFVEVSKKKKK